MLEKVMTVLAALMFMSTLAMADGAKVVAKVPDGVDDVYLMSQGTADMLKFLHGKYDSGLKSLDARYNVSGLKSLVDKTAMSSMSDSSELARRVKQIRDEYISRISIRVNKVRPYISPESSATGEIEFTYTAVNNSDRIIADVVYTPVIGKMEIPASSTLILDFVDRTTMKAGLAPGRTMTTTEKDADSFNFLLGQMNKNDLAYIKDNAEKALTLKIRDIHFTNSIQYKDQSRVLSIEEAFPERLGELETKGSSEKKLSEENLRKYKQAQAGFDEAKSSLMIESKYALAELKKSAVRYSSKAGGKGRAVFTGVQPGDYFVYCLKDGQAVFKEVSVAKSRVKVKAYDLQRDPFKP